ncbi:MAG: hypothetical protein JWP72_3657 [Massilia sp.]|nr:hypothetical protein [Massilia sp.]
MQITESSFLIFFIAVLLVHRLLQGQHGWQKLALTVASYYFYATYDWRFLGLLLALTAINFVAGDMVVRASSVRHKRWSIAAAVILSMAILAYFKYLNFFGEMVNSLARVLGGGSLVPYVDVILPVGISFMTFQAITYPIDLYYGRLKQPYSLLDFSLFIAFFPRLLAGPIVPAAQFLPQLETVAPRVSADQRFDGVALIMLGLFKKIVLADILGSHLVNPAFEDPDAYSSLFLWVALFGYSFQVYLDLSGYSDMAIGAARMLGYELPSNFNRPYLATSIASFWRRWHITMSSFFRNYLYIPLASAWQAPVTVNLLIVFVAIGLWHGAGMNFVVYGLIHGSFVAWERYRKDERKRHGLAPKEYEGAALVGRIMMVFSIVVLSRILFRSPDFDSAAHYVSLMLSSPSSAFPLSKGALFALLAAALLHFSPQRWRDAFVRTLSGQSERKLGLGFVAILYVSMMFTQSSGGFIYFRF